MAGVGRGLWSSSSPAPAKAGSPRAGSHPGRFWIAQRRRLHKGWGRGEIWERLSWPQPWKRFPDLCMLPFLLNPVKIQQFVLSHKSKGRGAVARSDPEGVGGPELPQARSSPSQCLSLDPLPQPQPATSAGQMFWRTELSLNSGRWAKYPIKK